MFPRPATVAWSSSATFSDVLRPARARASTAAENVRSSGSGPRTDSAGSVVICSGVSTFMNPKRRGSLNTTVVAVRHLEDDVVVGAEGVAIVRRHIRDRSRGAGPSCRGHETSRTCPGASPGGRRRTSSTIRYFARRVTASDRTALPAAPRSRSQTAAAGWRGAGSPARSGRPPSRGSGTGERIRLRGAQALEADIMMPMRRFLVIACALMMCVGVAADEGMWTFNNVPRDAIARKYHVTLTDQWLQHLQQSVGAPRKRLHRIVRVRRGADSDQSSLLGRVPDRSLHRAARPDRAGLRRHDARTGGAVPGTGGLGADGHRERHAAGDEGDHRGPGRAGGRGAQQDADRSREPVRRRRHEGRHAAQVRSGDAIPGRPVLALQVQALRRHPADVCA